MVVPTVAALFADDAGGVRCAAGSESERIGFVDTAAVPMLHKVFVGTARGGIFRPGFPDTGRDLAHRQIIGIPEIKIADYADGMGVGCPEAKNESIHAVAPGAVAAQK